MSATSQSETGLLKQVILKHASDAFVSDSAIEAEWKELGFSERPDFTKAVEEYDHFVQLLLDSGAEIQFLPRSHGTNLDAIYVRDASLISDYGVILCSMGKRARHGEPEAILEAYRALDIPILGQIRGEGLLEGGDVVWLDKGTLVVGNGYRTNAQGIGQLRELLHEYIDDLIVAQLPHWRGPDDLLHLMSIISPIDADLALVFSPLMPVALRQELLRRGYQLLEVPGEEFGTLGCNVLAVAPRKCIMVAGNPRTRMVLEDAGVEVYEFEGKEICLKGAGGPTCLTRPTLRIVE